MRNSSNILLHEGYPKSYLASSGPSYIIPNSGRTTTYFQLERGDTPLTGVQTLLTPEQVFRLHPKIRWTAFARNGRIVFCKMAPGFESYTSPDADRSFMEFGPLIITGVSERLSSPESAGIVESVIINFEKDSVLLMRVKDGDLAISVDRPHSYGVFQEIESRIKTLFD